MYPRPRVYPSIIDSEGTPSLRALTRMAKIPAHQRRAGDSPRLPAKSVWITQGANHPLDVCGQSGAQCVPLSSDTHVHLITILGTDDSVLTYHECDHFCQHDPHGVKIGPDADAVVLPNFCKGNTRMLSRKDTTHNLNETKC